MIYNGATITSTSAFQAWWQKLATEFKSDSHVVFDLQNEPHDIPAATVFDLMQAGVNGVRAAGATSQLILVEGTSWTGAWTWVSSGNSAVFGAIKDPNNNVAIRACPSQSSLLFPPPLPSAPSHRRSPYVVRNEG